jgi:hypothetical protein
MAYLHIDNLYKAQEILAFKECYALEKIHGTSAHIHWRGKTLRFFAGGVSYETFLALFDTEALTAALKANVEADCTIYGEAYGGKCQGMNKTYGSSIRFVAFDVKIGESWLSVPQAHQIVKTTGLDFVHYLMVPTSLQSLDAERDAPSVQAVKNGISEPKIREGVVLRPPYEATLNNGKRIIAKHKRPEFRERQSIPEIDPTKRHILENAVAVALEWVTPNRLAHVLDKLVGEKDISLTGTVIQAMVDDVLREAEGEIVTEKAVQRAIGGRAAKLYKAWLASTLGHHETPV